MTVNMCAQQERVVFVHKHPTSARTRFLRFREQTICGFSPLPELSQLLSSELKTERPVMESHPALILKQAAERLALAPSAMVVEPEYHMWVDASGGPVRILLVRFTDIDPPFECAEAIGAHFIDLTGARDLPPVELLLLRRAYEVLLGG